MTAADGEDPATLPEDLSAVCLDANCMSKGRLNLGAIADLVDVIGSQELDVQVWVPEPVLWEWAEHLASDLESARAVYQGAKIGADAAGVAHLVGITWDEPVDVVQVVSGIQHAIEEIEGANVLHLTRFPHAAIEGVRDQVLLQGAARRKSNVKTGAADSTSFRLAEAALVEFGGTMLIVSGDQDARSHLASKPNIVLMNSLSRAKAGIVGMRTGSEIALGRVRGAILSRLPRLTKTELGSPEVEHGASLEISTRLRGRVMEASVELVSIDHVVSLSDVEVSRSEGYAAALVDVLVSVERELQVLNDLNSIVEMDVETFDGLPATVEVSAESDNGHDWEIVVDKIHLG